MDTKKYAVVEKVVERASLTKAAEELGLTQSGVSHIVAAVEAELGLPLLKRTRTGARLTPEGERLMPHIRAIVAEERLLHQTAEELHTLAAGKVHPQVEFELFNGDYHDVDRWLADGSVDLAFVALPAEADSRCVPLYRDELVAVLPKGHRLCSLPVCPAAEIAKEPIISLLETSNHDVRRALDAVGAKPDIRFRTKDDYAVIAMVRQGLGVSIMPSLLLRGNNEGVELRPLDPPAYRTIALTMGSVETGPAARQFAEFARAWVKENA